jgi:hypothetical protein
MWYYRYLGVRECKRLSCRDFARTIYSNELNLNIPEPMNHRLYSQILSQYFQPIDSPHEFCLMLFMAQIATPVPKHIAICVNQSHIIESPTKDTPSRIRRIDDYANCGLVSFYRPNGCSGFKVA